jgi:hypothetical protein
LKGGETFSWWSKSQHNWNQVCNGGLSVGALALAELEPELAADLLQRALVSIQLPMKEFAPDGAWIEGPGYWNYATSYNCYLLASLQSALDTDFGLSRMPAFDKTGMFPIYITGPFGHTFNYADGGEEAIVAPQMFWLANTFNRPQYADYQRKLSRGTALDLLWQRPFPTNSAPAPLDACFHKSEIASFRSSWQDKSALFAAIKAGDNKANHGHLDLGSFVLDALGVRWVSDLGAEDYNLPGYFGSKRWEYYRLRAEGHNTLVINPGSKPDQDPKAEAQLIRFSSRPEFAFTIADLTPAYATKAQKVQRGLAMLDRKRVLVQDEIEMEKPGQLWWFCHTTARIILDADGKGAVLEKNDQRLRVTLANPPDARFEVMEAQPLADSPHPKGQNANKDIRKLSLHLDGVKTVCIRVCFTPLTDGNDGNQLLPPVRPLSEW